MANKLVRAEQSKKVVKSADLIISRILKYAVERQAEQEVDLGKEMGCL